jgi:prefoldin subunit 5
MTNRKTSAKNAPVDAAAIKKQIETLASHIAKLETPIHDARNLAAALRMMAGSNEIVTEAGAALDTVASHLLEILASIGDERDDIWQMALNTARDVPVAS